MDLETLRRDYKNQILEIAEICHVEKIQVFGSVARGESKGDSDIDFLVSMKPNSGLSICGIQWRLEELLNIKVDVVSDQHLHHRIREQILKEAVFL